MPRQLERFPDGEIHVRLERELRDADTYVVQSTGPPSQEHLTELLLLADAVYRAGAARVTAVIPYLADARQNRRTATGEPVGLRVVADVLRASHVDRLVVVDPHTSALESGVGVPVETTTAVPLLASPRQTPTHLGRLPQGRHHGCRSRCGSRGSAAGLLGPERSAPARLDRPGEVGDASHLGPATGRDHDPTRGRPAGSCSRDTMLSDCRRDGT